MKRLIPLVCVMFLSSISFAQNLKHATTNQDIVDMVKAQLSAELIIKEIQTADSVNFDTSPQEIIKLKKSGVEERIIMAMLERAKVKQGQDVDPDVAGEGKSRPDKPGQKVYINEDGTYGPEIEKAVKAAGEKSAVTVKSEKQSVKAKAFTFELDTCGLSGDVITCDVMVTNNASESMQLRFLYVSTMVDDQGNEFRAAQKSIGGNDSSEATLSRGVPVRARLVFEGIQKAPKIVKLLRLSLSTPPVIGGRRIAGGGSFKVEFKDIPLAQ